MTFVGGTVEQLVGDELFVGLLLVAPSRASEIRRTRLGLR